MPEETLTLKHIIATLRQIEVPGREGLEIAEQGKMRLIPRGGAYTSAVLCID